MQPTSIKKETNCHQLKLPLFRHQEDSVWKLLDFAQGFGLFSEQGTGKTITCIAAMNHLALERYALRVLIVCPNSLKYTWAKELEKSANPWEVKVLDGASARRLNDLSYINSLRLQSVFNQVVITNYDSLPKLVTGLNKWSPHLIIADEVTAIKNHKAKRTKALKAIKCEFKWALTGTPAVNSPLDIWSIFDWIRPGHFAPNFYAFRARYADVYTGAGFPLIKGYRNLKELSDKVEKYSFRVLKKDCLDLPEKIWSIREFDLSKEERSIYNAMANEMVAEVEDQLVPASTILVKTLRLCQITGGFVGHEDKVIGTGTSKLSALGDLLDELDGQKIVIWAHFRHDLDQIEALLKQRSLGYVRIDGDVTADRRSLLVELFQIREERKIFLCNVSVGAYGLTLTAASHCIYYSNTWSLGDRLQSQDRLHRIGQKNTVNYYDLVAKDTIDQTILDVIDKKRKLSDKITKDDLRQMVYGN